VKIILSILIVAFECCECAWAACFRDETNITPNVK